MTNTFILDLGFLSVVTLAISHGSFEPCPVDLHKDGVQTFGNRPFWIVDFILAKLLM